MDLYPLCCFQVADFFEHWWPAMAWISIGHTSRRFIQVTRGADPSGLGGPCGIPESMDRFNARSHGFFIFCNFAKWERNELLYIEMCVCFFDVDVELRFCFHRLHPASIVAGACVSIFVSTRFFCQAAWFGGWHGLRQKLLVFADLCLLKLFESKCMYSPGINWHMLMKYFLAQPSHIKTNPYRLRAVVILAERL